MIQVGSRRGNKLLQSQKRYYVDGNGEDNDDDDDDDVVVFGHQCIAGGDGG